MSSANRPSVADKLFEELIDIIDLWHDPQRRAHATIMSESMFQNRRLDSKDFASHLAAISHRRFRRGLAPPARDEVVQRLESVAVHEGPCRGVFSRIGWSGDNAYIALHDERGSVVEIRCDGWSLVEANTLDLRFVSSPTALALPLPVQGGSIEDLGRILQLKPGDLRLVVAYLVGCFLPHGAFPLLRVSGEQGSGKSLTTRLIKSVVDPARSPLRPLPRDLGSLMAAVEAAHVLAFDNLGVLSSETSDDLCRIASGSGLAKRRLYTDADEHVTEARRPVILNGIADVVRRPDLADRSIVLELMPFASGARRSEEELFAEFAEALPGILGDLLDRVSRALARRAEVVAPDVRLVDHARFAIAACKDAEEATLLRQDLLDNAERVKRSVIDEDDFAMAILEVIEHEDFAGSAADLLIRLEPLGAYRLPKSATEASHRLTRLTPALRGISVIVTKQPKTRVGILWTIAKERDWYIDEDGVRRRRQSAMVAQL